MAKAKKTSTKPTYSGKDIKVLEFPANVRKRPTMYIGAIGIAGNDHLLRETRDNSIDEHLNGHGNTIKLEISNKEGWSRVTDEGRGMPVDNGALERAVCTLHASGKFDDGSYQVSGGLNGVGASCVNALSTEMTIDVKKDGFHWRQEFAKGKPTTKLIKGKKLTKKDKTGTVTFFKPDKSIMGATTFDLENIKLDLEMQSYLNKGLRLILVDVDAKETIEYYHEDGIVEFINDNNESPIIKPIYFEGESSYEHEIVLDEESGVTDTKIVKMSVEVAIAYKKRGKEELTSFCNSILTTEGGTHEQGFRMAITQSFNTYIKKSNLITKKDGDLKITGDNVRDGLIAVVSVKHNEPLYAGQTKQKLSNSDIQGVVQKLVKDELDTWISENDKDAKMVAKKIILAAKAAEAARKAKENTTKKGESGLSIMSDLAKLADCMSTDPTKSEICLVEGDSAGGTAKMGRDKEFQAIYSLKGKPKNTNNDSAIKVLDNKELADLIYILTGKKTAIIEDDFDLIAHLKYHKIIIMADADVDGYHIQSLILTFIFRHLPELIFGGYVYIALPPLYSVKEGKTKRFIIDEDEYEAFIVERIIKSFDIAIDVEDELQSLTKVKLTKLLKFGRTYNTELNTFITEDGIHKEVAEGIINFLIDGDIGDVDDFINENYDELTALYNDDDDSFIVDGMHGDEYHNFFINDDFVESIQPLVDMISKGANSTDLYYAEKGGDEYEDIFLGALIDLLYKKATPSSRQRLKGLGEMDADDLWDTTMNPVNRTLIKVVVDDEESADETMHNLMNKLSKFADKRKVFLLKNQAMVKGEDLDV